ncbi:hypothetical protein HK104_002149 [Borealophlyctis nickersoniae]|nr:hypothetical protein HK104_002149 [Borealophlyctis nickersoniae]
MEDIWLFVVNEYLSMSEAGRLKQTGKSLHAAITQDILFRVAANWLRKTRKEKALLHVPAALPDTQSAALATLLIQRGAVASNININEKLVQAGLLGKTAFFKVLLSNGAYIGDIASDGYEFHCPETQKTHHSALSAAAYAGHNETVKFLLDNLYFGDERFHLPDNTYLRYFNATVRDAIDGGQMGTVQFLLDESKDKGQVLDGVLESASFRGRVDMVELALAYAEQVGVTPDLRNPLLTACRGRKDCGLDVIRLFLDRGVDPDPNRTIDNEEGSPDVIYSTPMHAAITANNLKAIKLLLARGATLPENASHLARQHPKTLKFLLDHVSKSLKRAFKHAVHSSETSGVKLLLDRFPEDFGAPHLISRHLRCAVREASVPTVKLLLSRGAGIEELGHPDYLRVQA